MQPSLLKLTIELILTIGSAVILLLWGSQYRKMERQFEDHIHIDSTGVTMQDTIYTNHLILK